MMQPIWGWLAVWVTMFGLTAAAQAGDLERNNRYLEVVRKFGKTLDTECARPVEQRHQHVPARGVWPVVVSLGSSANQAEPWSQQANLLYDASTLHVMRVLAETIDEGRHRLAANGYVTDYLEHAQSSSSGLLGWGPELALHMKQGDVVSMGQTSSEMAGGHQLLARTTPWDVLWDSNPSATTKAITGLERHFPQRGSPYFTRNGAFVESSTSKVDDPNCEQAGSMAHAFAFLYNKTGDRHWMERARMCVDAAWSRRDPATKLVPQRLSEKPAEDARAGSGQVLLGYLLLKAWKEAPHENAWGHQAISLLNGYDHFAFDPKSGNWYASVRLDGLLADQTADNAEPDASTRPMLPVWGDPGEQGISVAILGRAAAYAAGVTRDQQCLAMARRSWDLLKKTPRPAETSTYPLAFALGLSLDLYDLTQEKRYLEYAQSLADLTITRYWNGRLFRSRPHSDLYDARLASGDLAAGLLRLHIRLQNFRPPRLYDWTF